MTKLNDERLYGHSLVVTVTDTIRRLQKEKEASELTFACVIDHIINKYEIDITLYKKYEIAFFKSRITHIIKSLAKGGFFELQKNQTQIKTMYYTIKKPIV